jgi:hypothetical protein
MESRIRWVKGILLPLTASALCIWAAAQSGTREWEAFLAFLLTGSFLYLAARLSRRTA